MLAVYTNSILRGVPNFITSDSLLHLYHIQFEEILRSLEIPVEATRRFITATGERVERDLGYVIVHAAGERTIDEVVFARPGDMILLGARSLEGLNLRVDPKAKQLVNAGPILAGAA